MIKKQFLIRSSADANITIRNLKELISDNKQNLPNSSLSLIDTFIKTNVLPLVKQLEPSDKIMRADKNIKGDGFDISIKVRSGPEGFLKKIYRILGK